MASKPLLAMKGGRKGRFSFSFPCTVTFGIQRYKEPYILLENAKNIKVIQRSKQKP